MSGTFILLWMIMMHIVDDFYLQKNLALYKQKSWWEENYPDEKYKHDHIAALFIHSISWAFMIMFPIAYTMNFNIGFEFIWMFAVNVFGHALVDDAKANMLTINLWQDQLMHLGQIIITMYILIG
jgi:hypothetical protein